MNPHPTTAQASQSSTTALPFDVIAGLPAAVGPYIEFIPMVIYAGLGSSQVLSVSSSTTLAIVAGTQLGRAVPDGEPGEARHRDDDADRAGRRDAAPGERDASGVCRQPHFRASPDRLQNEDRSRDSVGPSAEAPGNSHREARLPPRLR